MTFEIEISEKPLRAFVADWDLEIWGGDPEAAFRGSAGGGYATDLKVGGTSYYSETVSLLPGDLFDSSFDASPGATHDPTLINGNEHAVRGNTSGIVEVSAADGAVGNFVQWTFDANHGGADEGWITAVDNVRIRALAAGDAQGDGDVDPFDLTVLLGANTFGKGNVDATWQQGDFDNDGDFDATDVIAILQALAGEFPKTFADTPGNGVPVVIIDPATGNVTVNTDGIEIGNIVIDSAAGIFNGANSPSWDAPGAFSADIDTQISMPINFGGPGFSGVDNLGDGVVGATPAGFDFLADLTVSYLDPGGALLDGEIHIVPEPSSMILATLGVLGMLGYYWPRRSFERVA